MSWIRLEDNYSVHRKTAKFARLMGNPLAEAYLTRLWTWASACQPDGNLAGMDDADLADSVRFPGDPAILGDALRQSGFLDPNGMIHDWDHYQGAVVDKRNRDRARAAEERAKRKIDPTVQAESRDGSATVARPSRDDRATVAGPSRPTVRDGTVRDETKNEERLSSADDAPAQVSLLPEPPPPPAPVDPMEAKIDLVLAHWQRTHGPNIDVSGETQAGLERRRRVRKHLKAKISVEQMIAACDGALRDAYIMGRDPKAPRAYRGVETILRDGTQIEKLAALRGGPNAPASPQGASNRVPVAPPVVAMDWTAAGELSRALNRPEFLGGRDDFRLPENRELPPGFQIPDGMSVVRVGPVADNRKVA